VISDCQGLCWPPAAKTEFCASGMLPRALLPSCKKVVCGVRVGACGVCVSVCVSVCVECVWSVCVVCVGVCGVHVSVCGRVSVCGVRVECVWSVCGVCVSVCEYVCV
jgi:hypothetical protein